jgi:hypothetical protein
VRQCWIIQLELLSHEDKFRDKVINNNSMHNIHNLEYTNPLKIILHNRVLKNNSFRHCSVQVEKLKFVYIFSFSYRLYNGQQSLLLLILVFPILLLFIWLSGIIAVEVPGTCEFRVGGLAGHATQLFFVGYKIERDNRQ